MKTLSEIGKEASKSQERTHTQEELDLLLNVIHGKVSISGASKAIGKKHGLGIYTFFYSVTRWAILNGKIKITK